MGSAVVGAAVLCTAALLPGRVAYAAGTPSPYAFAPDTPSVTGATSTVDAAPLEVGRTYRSSLPASSKLYYGLTLDDTSNVYVSVTAVPRARTKVSPTAGIRVLLQNADERSCSAKTTYVGRSPRPIVAWGARETFSPRALCKGGGTYYVVVERLDGTEASPDDWELELAPVSEPGLKQDGGTSPPEDWDSASPEPLTSKAVRRPGGAGFDEAARVGQGAWSSGIEPGQTLFYAVPVDWGRQLEATAELGSATGDSGAVSNALTMSLYNPARMPVAEVVLLYSGTQKAKSFNALPPVDYENRYATADRARAALRFAGSYYLVLHLSERVAEKYGDGPFEVTLRVRVRGTSEAAPGYSGPSDPQGLFEVPAQDRATAPEGGGGVGDDAVLTVVAAAGIGAGTLLLAVLGAWSVVARRRAGAR
ncbi:hypothetical protein [Streptomyces sp. S.PB5]|uniref:hypothetical protein n=1 Tax=Streptomyces sp. S.PB5 TaxID=3020844 RepID=UPI0025B03B74|nr:hypothetical protein [Streptomyces sp. S.PB5]MDN3023692.1 hypothetical protein [Streptomyces sp. S.PB5]